MTKSAPSSAARRSSVATTRRAAEALRELLGGARGDLEPLGVDVVQREVAARAGLEAQEVGDQLAGEDDAAGAEERDLGHAWMIVGVSDPCKNLRR